MPPIDQPSHDPLSTQESGYSDPFSEPRTLPSSWDLSSLLNPPTPSPNGRLQPLNPSPAASLAPPTAEAKTPWTPDPFPVPRTYPAKWDINA